MSVSFHLSSMITPFASSLTPATIVPCTVARTLTTNLIPATTSLLVPQTLLQPFTTTSASVPTTTRIRLFSSSVSSQSTSFYICTLKLVLLPLVFLNNFLSSWWTTVSISHCSLLSSFPLTVANKFQRMVDLILAFILIGVWCIFRYGKVIWLMHSIVYHQQPCRPKFLEYL